MAHSMRTVASGQTGPRFRVVFIWHVRPHFGETGKLRGGGEAYQRPLEHVSREASTSFFISRHRSVATGRDDDGATERREVSFSTLTDVRNQRDTLPTVQKQTTGLSHFSSVDSCFFSSLSSFCQMIVRFFFFFLSYFLLSESAVKSDNLESNKSKEEKLLDRLLIRSFSFVFQVSDQL